MADGTEKTSKRKIWAAVKHGVTVAASAVAWTFVTFGRKTAAVFSSARAGDDAFRARFARGFDLPSARGSTADAERDNARNRTYLIAVGGVLAAMLFCTVALWAGTLWKITEVTVTGCDHYAPAAVAYRGGLVADREFLGIDSRTAERRIREAFPLIEEVKVEKHLNGRVTVEVTEYTDLYYTCHNQNYYVIAAEDKQVLQVASAGTVYRDMGAVYIGLPAEARVRVGEPLTYAYLPYDMSEAETLYDTRAEDANEEFAYVDSVVSAVMNWALADRVTGMELSDRYTMYIILDGRIKVTVGKQTDLERKLAFAANFLSNDDGDGDIPAVLDVSDHENASYRRDATLILPDWAVFSSESDPNS